MKITARFLKASLLLIWVLHAVHGTILNNSFPITKEAKIVGGDEVYFYGTFICGGSLVVVNERQRIITAAHCLILSQDTSSYAVVAGEVQAAFFGMGQARNVAQIRIHAGFDMPANQNDIAILTTDRPFYINKYVSPIRLPRKNERVCSCGVVSGWGRISENGPSSRVLIKAKILVGPDAQCRRTYPDIFVPSTMICAGIRRGACKGDSGGPLCDYKRGFLAGIVSFNSNHVNCTKPMHNAVRVSAYVDWISAQWV